jgi:acyl-CoA thioester hydrolase
MSLHVSLDTRRAASMAPEILDRLGTILAAHQKLPLPAQVGRSIGLSKRPGQP